MAEIEPVRPRQTLQTFLESVFHPNADAAHELLPNLHPGETLQLEFMTPLGLSQNTLARAVHVPPRRINELVHGRRAITADTDLRLARYFGLSEGFFLGLQADHDLMAQRRKLAGELESIEPRAA
jgi:addiction module HigA family antidote